MKIVIDSNRVIAALLKDSTTRSILYDKKFDFVAPSYIFSEIKKYKEDIAKRIGMSDNDFGTLLKLVFDNITIIPEAKYSKIIKELNKEISDFKDLSYLAVAVLTEAKGIWTHDLHFKEQSKIKIFTNIDLLRFINKED